MSYVKAQLSVPQIEDANGNPASGYTISSYIWDTSTPTPMYTSSAGAGSATSFTLNSLGQPQTAGGTAVDIFLDSAITYKFIIRDASSQQVGPTIGPLKPSDGTANTITFLQSGAGAVERDANAKMGELAISITDFGAIGDGVTDNTIDLLKVRALVAARAALGLATRVRIPAGTYCYTDIGNWAFTGLTVEGDCDGGSILKCTSATPNHTAFKIWAFESGSPSDPFIQKCNLADIKVEGNANTAYIIRAYGIARCNWRNVTARSGNSSTGRAFNFNACSINKFENLICSADYESQSPAPAYGIYVDTGERAGVNLGSSTNNTFINVMMEGVGRGVKLTAADQNLFLGGAAESCTVTGLEIDGGGRINTFINFALEGNGTYDINDAGFLSRYINCYGLGTSVFTALNSQIDGGLWQSVGFQVGSAKCAIRNCQINYSGGGGFTDNGDASEWKNLYDRGNAQYIYPLKARANIVVGASPFTYTNNSRQYQEVIIQTGTISQIRRFRDGVPFLAPITVPGCILLAPMEQLEVTYSVAPAMSYLPHNGFQG